MLLILAQQINTVPKMVFVILAADLLTPLDLIIAFFAFLLFVFQVGAKVSQKSVRGSVEQHINAA